MKLEFNEYAYTGKEFCGMSLWVCAYYFTYTGNENPQRNVIPTNVQVGDNGRFRVINSKGDVTKKEIKLFGNTSGAELNLFTDEKECKLYYLELRARHITSLEYDITLIKNKIAMFKEEYDSVFVKLTSS